MPDSVNPKIRGHRISQVMPKATESAWMTASIIRSSPQQTLHGERRLAHVRVGVRSCDEAVRDAMSEVVLQQRHGDLVQRTGDRGDLREDVDAVGVLLNHPLDPADLTLDPAKPNEQPILVVVIPNHRRPPRIGGSIPPWGIGCSSLCGPTKSWTRRSSRDFDVRRGLTTERAARIVA